MLVFLWPDDATMRRKKSFPYLMNAKRKRVENNAINNNVNNSYSLDMISDKELSCRRNICVRARAMLKYCWSKDAIIKAVVLAFKSAFSGKSHKYLISTKNVRLDNWFELKGAEANPGIFCLECTKNLKKNKKENRFEKK